MPLRSCPTGCNRSVRPGHLMCGTCWAEVPQHLQREVYRTWRLLQRGADDAVEQYQAAREAAIASVP